MHHPFEKKKQKPVMFQSSVNMSPGDPTHKWAPTEFNLWHSVGPATNKQSSSVSCFFFLCCTGKKY